MKSRNVLAALTVAGLAAVAATPAMALENQFSGAFVSFYSLSNYSANGVLAKDAPTQNYFVQRARLGYTAKASENAKLVTKFELDYNYYGNNSYTVARGGGAALGADSVNIETKNIYLDFNLPSKTNVKIGMQPYNDSFKGILFDADMAGILFTQEYKSASVSAGFFRFADSDAANIGKSTHDMISLDGKYSLNKNTTLGAAYYYIADDTANDAKVHTIGINGSTSIGPVGLTAFAVAQTGDMTATKKAKGYALNLGAKAPLAGGTVRSEVLYVAGGKNAFYIPASVNGGTEGGGFYDNEMIILSRDKNATTIDNALVYDVNNANKGVFFASAGYDYTFTPKLSGSANLGIASAANNGAQKNFMGTEINFEANYKVIPEVTIGARAGYVFLGDYFKATPKVDNPYDMKIIAKYSF
jgi:hypothetical protein